MMKKESGLKEKEQIEIGDLVAWESPHKRHGANEGSAWESPLLAGIPSRDRTITGIVVGTTHEDQKDPQAEDYWVRVVFLDGTKSTLFHDETKILVKNGNR